MQLAGDGRCVAGQAVRLPYEAVSDACRFGSFVIHHSLNDVGRRRLAVVVGAQEVVQELPLVLVPGQCRVTSCGQDEPGLGVVGGGGGLDLRRVRLAELLAFPSHIERFVWVRVGGSSEQCGSIDSSRSTVCWSKDCGPGELPSL